MKLRKNIIRFLRSDWGAALVLLLVFLITRGYLYGWDDQHLEIPLLKSLIDNGLYQHDYYVQSLKQNFTSYFYPLLARLITIESIPIVYFLLFLISRYFLFFWTYKLWRFIAGDTFTAWICGLLFLFCDWVPEFLYRTFSHQEFSLALIAAGIYFFYRERFILAAAILGIAANFHALYSMFPMTYLGIYLLIYWKKYRWKTVAQSYAAFVVCALPVLVWMVVRTMQGHFIGGGENSSVDWLTLYKIAAPQNFIFNGITMSKMFTHLIPWIGVAKRYLVALALILVCSLHSETFRKDTKARVIILTSAMLLTVTYFFSYWWPSRFVMNLNLVRAVQFVFFVMQGHFTIVLVRLIEKERPGTAFIAALALVFLFLPSSAVLLAVTLLGLFLVLKKYRPLPKDPVTASVASLIIAALITGIAALLWLVYLYPLWLSLTLLAMALILTGYFLFVRTGRVYKNTVLTKRLFIGIPLGILFLYLCFNHSYIFYQHRQRNAWKVQGAWEDMQRYVQAHTPKDAMLLVPYDMVMGGFRILSERAIVCSYRDCGIIGFDYDAAVEWIKRLRDIVEFKVRLSPHSTILPAVTAARYTYNVDYIVFMSYYAPRYYPTDRHQEVYRNEFFVLVKIAK